jgi:hypothetical protein
MTPEGYIERLERIVNAGRTRNAEQFIAKHGAATEPLLTPAQEATVAALKERMQRIDMAAATPVVVGTSGTNPLPLAEAAARKITVYGDAEPKTIEQMARCVAMDFADAFEVIAVADEDKYIEIDARKVVRRPDPILHNDLPIRIEMHRVTNNMAVERRFVGRAKGNEIRAYLPIIVIAQA